MFKTPPPMTFRRIFGDIFPRLNFFVSLSKHDLADIGASVDNMCLQPDERSKIVAASRAAVRRIGMQLITDKKAAVAAARASGEVKKKDVGGRDLLALLIRANMAIDIPDSQRLSDEEVLSREFRYPPID